MSKVTTSPKYTTDNSHVSLVQTLTLNEFAVDPLILTTRGIGYKKQAISP